MWRHRLLSCRSIRFLSSLLPALMRSDKRLLWILIPSSSHFCVVPLGHINQYRQARKGKGSRRDLSNGIGVISSHGLVPHTTQATICLCLVHSQNWSFFFVRALGPSYFTLTTDLTLLLLFPNNQSCSCFVFSFSCLTTSFSPHIASSVFTLFFFFF